MAQDEGIRPSTTMEGLAKLKPAFKEGGCTTAGETGREVGRKGPGSGEEGAVSVWVCSSSWEPQARCMWEGWASSALL